MTPVGLLLKSNYPGIKTLLSSMDTFLHIGFWERFVGISMGQISYLIISSFGMILFALPENIRGWINAFVSKKRGAEENCQILIIYTSLALLFIIAMGSWLFATPILNIDELLYGRYTESLVPFLIAIGFISFLNYQFKTRLKIAVIGLLVVFFTGIFIDLYLPLQNIHVSSQNNIMNIPAFWPQYLTDYSTFLLWLTIGAVGIMVVTTGGKYVAILFMILSFFVSYSGQAKWHKTSLDHYSKPSSFIDIIRSNFVPGTCIGFDDQFPNNSSRYQIERYNIYEYYFFDYNYRRMTPNEWLNSCSGPFLTYNYSTFTNDGAARIVARDITSELFLITKTNNINLVIPNKVINRNDIYFFRENRKECAISGCFSMNASQLSQLSQVGTLLDNNLTTTNRSGYLFYGPYIPMTHGKYLLILHGKFDAVANSTLDIISDGGEVIINQTNLSEYQLDSDQPLVLPFEIDSDMQNFEIRLKVQQEDKIWISGYEVVLAQESNIQPTKVR